MGVIRVLPQPVVNKIAAGEVIERPASVVKELLENSLDARASSITVEVEDGGKKLIRVADDGFGMAPDDLALAFGSHTTSKLKDDEDLSFIATLGFRGEALASVGSVSHARIVSRLQGATEGAEAEVRGGAPQPVRAKGAPEGTTVEVANLFYNVPARRKFLRATGTEYGHVVDCVSRIALANPAVGFKLIHNGRETLTLRAGSDRRRRLGELYGKDLADALLEVDSGEGPVHVVGFAAPPVYCRANAKMQFTYVNGRFVRDRSIAHAIGAAYEGLLVHGRHPVVFLFLQMDPREVDVNVHPTKIEVRFHQGQMVHKTVLNAVREALRGADLAPVFEPGARSETAVGPPRRERAAASPGAGGPLPFDRPSPRGAPPLPGPATGAPVAPREGRCFQVHNAYIVEERADGIAIIDQHALHERVLFEGIRRRLGTAKLERQRLLVPAVVRLTRAEAALLLSEKEGLADVGLELSEFGGDSVAVNALPAVLGQADPAGVLHEIFAGLEGEPRDAPVEARRLAIARMIACKAAVKAGDRLTESEMQSLLERGETLAGADTCPHGRPARIFLPYADLERQFKRQ